jgi:hypothetical protein
MSIIVCTWKFWIRVWGRVLQQNSCIMSYHTFIRVPLVFTQKRSCCSVRTESISSSRGLLRARPVSAACWLWGWLSACVHVFVYTYVSCITRCGVASRESILFFVKSCIHTSACLEKQTNQAWRCSFWWFAETACQCAVQLCRSRARSTQGFRQRHRASWPGC